MTNSVDPDLMASSNWSGSTLFANVGVVIFSRIRVKFHERQLIIEMVYVSKYE